MDVLREHPRMTVVELALIGLFLAVFAVFDFGAAATIVTGALLLVALTVMTGAVLARSHNVDAG